MNWDRIEGNWKQLRGKVQQQWGKLTDDDLTTVQGRRIELVGKIQERYASPRTRPRSRSIAGSGICKARSVSLTSPRFEEVAAAMTHRNSSH
jgi:uncharacterized protein YjbJ (UPF0337 family)